MGTFSKTLGADLRAGYLAANPSTAAVLADLKMVTITATSEYSERLVYDLFGSGRYFRHLRRLRARLDQAHDEMRRQYAALGISLPSGSGLYAWLSLPSAVDELELVRRTAAESVFLAPGRVFSAGREEITPATRVNVACPSAPRFLSF